MMRRFIRGVLLLAAVVFGGSRATKKFSSPARSPEQLPSTKQPKPRTKKAWAMHTAVILAVLGVLGFLVAASGIMPIKASSGHWAITRWFLEFSMRRSVTTHSLGTKIPALDEPQLVLKGAGHFDLGCSPCHGTPAHPHPAIPAQMTPHPPYLPREIKNWDAAELFYIVKHGVKFTGMPAWPAQKRDDEVWAIVAFLLKLPALDAEEYRALVHGDDGQNLTQLSSRAATPFDAIARQVAEQCARCHGSDGNGRGVGAFPKLAGQRAEYLQNALVAYANGERHSGIMQPIAAGLSQAEIRDFSLFYSNLQPFEPGNLVNEKEGIAEKLREGELIAKNGVREQKIAACASCHGPAPTRRNPAYPKLAGQHFDYLMLQLELFRQKHRGGSPYADLMHKIAPKLTKEQMRAVALYYASLKPD